MRSETIWVQENSDVLNREVHERTTGLSYTVVAVAERGKTRLRRRPEFAGTANYLIRERLVVVFLKPAYCPAGWAATEV
jgi:hypothetical protein